MAAHCRASGQRGGSRGAGAAAAGGGWHDGRRGGRGVLAAARSRRRRCGGYGSAGVGPPAGHRRDQGCGPGCGALQGGCRAGATAALWSPCLLRRPAASSLVRSCLLPLAPRCRAARRTEPMLQQPPPAQRRDRPRAAIQRRGGSSRSCLLLWKAPARASAGGARRAAWWPWRIWGCASNAARARERTRRRRCPGRAAPQPPATLLQPATWASTCKTAWARRQTLAQQVTARPAVQPALAAARAAARLPQL